MEWEDETAELAPFVQRLGWDILEHYNFNALHLDCLAGVTLTMYPQTLSSLGIAQYLKQRKTLPTGMLIFETFKKMMSQLFLEVEQGGPSRTEA